MSTGLYTYRGTRWGATIVQPLDGRKALPAHMRKDPL
jgi:hypothetical protein